ncbi:MAG: hypothetical protein PVH00_09595 [Gemmatimonadota bacterium]|jgi:hypothetical protein
MNARGDLAAGLHVVNLSLLATHEIDSAYWHEWEMFHLPGGIQLFLVINLALLVPLTYGQTRLVRRQPGAKAFSYIVAAAGLFAFTIHTIFLAAGGEEFRAPVSLGVLVAILLVSIGQIVVAGRTNGTGSRYDA